jgi:hypothetical protein
MCVGEKKELLWGLWVCLKFSLRILKHSNDDDDEDDDDDDDDDSSSSTLWHTTAHSDLLQEGLKVNENSSHSDDVPVLYELIP